MVYSCSLLYGERGLTLEGKLFFQFFNFLPPISSCYDHSILQKEWSNCHPLLLTLCPLPLFNNPFGYTSVFYYFSNVCYQSQVGYMVFIWCKYIQLGA